MSEAGRRGDQVAVMGDHELEPSIVVRTVVTHVTSDQGGREVIADDGDRPLVEERVAGIQADYAQGRVAIRREVETDRAHQRATLGE